MLGAVQATPRPRPPSKVRRASSNQQRQASPPPPYASTLVCRANPEKVAASSTVTGTSRSSSDTSMQGVSEDWLNEVSREELAEILQKADGLIKERATELGLASAVAKTLHRKSASLKGKHEALLARIPYSCNSPAISSPGILSPGPSVSPPPSGTQTPHFYSAGLSREATVASLPSLLLSSGSDPATPLFHEAHRRARKISVSPTDIALLSDQNAELMQKLERLEADSVQADHAGRRKLNRLERDIQMLREELEKTREKSDALEERAKNGFGLITAESGRKEREEKVRLLRGGPNIGENDVSKAEEEIRDFAPASELRFSDSASFKSRPQDRDMDERPSPSRSSAFSHLQQFPSPEYNIIAQLLSKIQELEETNVHITCQQAETTNRLAAVQRDAANISKLYDLLSGQTGLDLELVVDRDDRGEASTPTKPAGETGTIRFRSLRRSLEGDVAKMLAEGTMKAHSAKTRKSVMGYFDHVPDHNVQDREISEDKSSPATPDVASSSQAIDSRLSEAGQRSRTNSGCLLSPALSSLSILTPHSHALRQLAQMVNEDGQGRTLESELGSGAGENAWGAQDRQPSHHLRTTSLYELSGAGDVLVDAPKAAEGAAETGGEPSTRNKRLSHTIRMRTNRWVDGRFKGTMLGDDTGGRNLDRPDDADYGASDEPRTSVQAQAAATSTAMPASLANAFGGMVGASTALDTEPLPGAPNAPAAGKKDTAVKHHKGLAKLVFEVWLLLQFVVIIVVFVFAMARKGPRDVLDAADRRKGK